jgi:D-glycero-beta-D-manno-heptose 1-phosphate adenylyltransferase
VSGLTLRWHSSPVRAARPVVATGVFDLLHVGHVRFLARAAAAGPLVVGVEDDARVRARKGPGRPLMAAEDRCELVGALRAVAGVFVVSGDPELWTPAAYTDLLRALGPSALALTEGDPALGGKSRTAAALGARVVVAPLERGHSTTLLAERIYQTFG